MRTEEGIIEKTGRNRARVRIERSSSCSQCESRGACQVVGGKSMVIDVPNPLQAKVGDRVEIAVPTGSFLKLTFLVYLLPVVALLLGAILGRAWGPAVGLQSPLSDVIGGALFVGLTFIILKGFDRTAGEKKDYQPVMRRIIVSAVPPLHDGNR
jgi:sigma-E factor negative regulatory protein RseC